MFPNRKLSLALMMMVCSSTALASGYECDRPDSTIQPSSPCSPFLFGTLISNLAGHLRLGNDQVTARSSGLVFDVPTLASPKEAFQSDTTPAPFDTSCRGPALVNRWGAQENAQALAQNFSIRHPGGWERVLTEPYDLRPWPVSGSLPAASRERLQTALVVDDSPCLVIPSLHSLLALFRPNHFTPDSIPLPTQRDAISEYTKQSGVSSRHLDKLAGFSNP
jgi:hypothetical protein